MRQVVAYKSLKTMENHETFSSKKWSQSLTGGGLLLEVPTVRLWLGKFRCFGLVVAYGRWSLMRGSCTWGFDCNKYIRDLTKPRRWRQQEPQKTIGLMSKTKTVHVHRAFLYIALPSLHNYDVKWPNFKFTWEREWHDDKFYHLCPHFSAFPSLQLQLKSPSYK